MRGGKRKIKRRSFLYSLVSAGTVGLAGCSRHSLEPESSTEDKYEDINTSEHYKGLDSVDRDDEEIERILSDSFSNFDPGDVNVAELDGVVDLHLVGPVEVTEKDIQRVENFYRDEAGFNFFIGKNERHYDLNEIYTLIDIENDLNPPSDEEFFSNDDTVPIPGVHRLDKQKDQIRENYCYEMAEINGVDFEERPKDYLRDSLYADVDQELREIAVQGFIVPGEYDETCMGHIGHSELDRFMMIGNNRQDDGTYKINRWLKAHEIGHTLNLKHIYDKDNLMHPNGGAWNLNYLQKKHLQNLTTNPNPLWQ